MTRDLRFLLALRPVTFSVTTNVRMAATLDRLPGARLLVNVVAGGNSTDMRADGNFLTHDARYAQTDEFLNVWKRLFARETVDFDGRYLKVEGARQGFPAVQFPYPPRYFGGFSPAAHAVASEHVDLYLSWGEAPADVAAKCADVAGGQPGWDDRCDSGYACT